MGAFVNSDGDLFSRQFSESYFSHGFPLEESTYVFLNGNRLESRFEKTDDFVIGETGFSSGLNFVNTMSLWKRKLLENPSNVKANLLYYSFEKYPLENEILTNFYDRIAIEDKVKKDFLVQFTKHKLEINKSSEINFENYNTKLILFVGDIQETIHESNFLADVWFFDGFSPAKNPEMWSSSVFSKVQGLTKIGATFATYTASGVVKRVLRKHGFIVRRVSGFGKKRHMLVGELQDK